MCPFVSLVPNGQVYETWQIAWHLSVKPPCSLSGLQTLTLGLSLPCFIQSVMPSPFFLLSVYMSLFPVFVGALTW